MLVGWLVSEAWCSGEGFFFNPDEPEGHTVLHLGVFAQSNLGPSGVWTRL